jgi:NTP pyrophosphatase (non-canonical NTP hydrolase)
MIRKRSKPHTLEEQLSAYAIRLKAEAAELSDGLQKSNLLEKVRQLEAASTMNDWLAPSS